MARNLMNCLQILLKFVNSVTGMVGIAVILYSLQMIKIWESDVESSSFDSRTELGYPWFIHAFVGTGIALCAVTSIGHVAARTVNNCCLICYTLAMFLLIMVETSLIAQVFVHFDWEKELPNDPAGRFDDFTEFVKSNADAGQLIGFFTIFTQGVSMFLAVVLRTLETNDCYENRLPLLNPVIHPFHP